jgi:hypothetical protein
MDDIRRDDLLQAMTTPLAVKAMQALQAMADGIELKRISIKLHNPHLDGDAHDQLLRTWLRGDD